MLSLVFQRNILRRISAGTLMETPDLGASPPVNPNDGTSAPFPAAVSPPVLISFSFIHFIITYSCSSYDCCDHNHFIHLQSKF